MTRENGPDKSKESKESKERTVDDCATCRNVRRVWDHKNDEAIYTCWNTRKPSRTVQFTDREGIAHRKGIYFNLENKQFEINPKVKILTVDKAVKTTLCYWEPVPEDDTPSDNEKLDHDLTSIGKSDGEGGE